MGQSLNWSSYFKVDPFYYKVWQALSQSMAASRYYKGVQELLQNAQVTYYKVGNRYCKVGHFITKWDRYYKVGQLLDKNQSPKSKVKSTI